MSSTSVTRPSSANPRRSLSASSNSRPRTKSKNSKSAQPKSRRSSSQNTRSKSGAKGREGRVTSDGWELGGRKRQTQDTPVTSTEHVAAGKRTQEHTYAKGQHPEIDNDQYWLHKYGIFNYRREHPEAYDEKETLDYVDYLTNPKRPFLSWKWQWDYRKEILRGSVRLAALKNE